jgi:hypothetical protein
VGETRMSCCPFLELKAMTLDLGPQNLDSLANPTFFFFFFCAFFIDQFFL